MILYIGHQVLKKYCSEIDACVHCLPMGGHGDPPMYNQMGCIPQVWLTGRERKQIISPFSMHDGTPAEIILAN